MLALALLLLAGSPFEFQPDSKAAYAIDNPRHQFRASFSQTSLALSTAGEKLEVRVKAFGCERDALSDLGPATTTLTQKSGSRLVRKYPVHAVEEWFVNGPSGLEQGFDLRERPCAAKGQVRIRLGVAAGWETAIQKDKVTFRRNGIRIDYVGIKSWDASGAPHDSWFERGSDGSSVDLVVNDAGARYPLTVDPTYIQVAKLELDDAFPGDSFGVSGSMNLTGDTAMIAVPGRGYNFTEGTIAVFFTRSGNIWTKQAALHAPGNSRNLAGLVAMSSDGNTTAVVLNTGLAIYVRSGTNWTLQATIPNPDLGVDPDAVGSFGTSLSISGDGNLIAVGTPTARINGDQDAGAVHVFVRSGTTWAPQQRLVAPDPSTAARFGSSAAMSADGTVLVIGAPNREEFQGGAYSFMRSGSTWTYQGSLADSTVTRLGVSAAVNADGTVAIVGSAELALPAGRNAVTVFTRTGAAWTKQAKIQPPEVQAGDNFGGTVQLDHSGTIAAISASGYSNGVTATGAAYLYTRSENTWTQGQRLVPLDAEDGDSFHAIAISGNGTTILGGAPGRTRSVASFQQGTAYVFTAPSDGCDYVLSTPETTVPNTGGSYSVGVTAGAGCAWTSSTQESWIHLTSPSSATGSGSVDFSVDPNSGSSRRSGTIQIAGQYFIVRQNPPCFFNLTSSGATFPGTSGNSGFVQVTSNCDWTAESSVPWITLANNGVPQGRDVQYFLTENTTGANRSGTITVAGMAFSVNQLPSLLPSGLTFVPVSPCRIIDTRLANGPFGGPRVEGTQTRTINVPASPCGIPANAQAYAVNLAVVPTGPLGYVTLFSAGQDPPIVSTLNSLDGRVKANAAIVPAGTNGGISVFASNATHIVIDINGYFIPAGGLSFYPVTPCRIADTRLASGPLGAPKLTAQTSRSFPVQSAPCGIPANAQAYSLNLSVVPTAGTLGYITTWPTGQDQPLVSTLNAVNGAVTANAAIVRAGTSGGVSVFASNDTELIIDINGYFAPAGAGGLSFYPMPPCRLVDTRLQDGLLGGPVMQALETRGFALNSSECLVPPTSYGVQVRALSLNATVLPESSLGFLTLWPFASTQPVVSTLNAVDGSLVANAAIVPTGPNTSVSAYVTARTHLLLDFNGYFAP
jgi:hypothetical protein